MLCDDLAECCRRQIAWIDGGADPRDSGGWETPEHNRLVYETTVASLAAAERFSLLPLVVETAADLAERERNDFARAREHLFLPFATLWLEWDDGPLAAGRQAVLIQSADGEAIRGEANGLYFRKPPGWTPAAGLLPGFPLHFPAIEDAARPFLIEHQETAALRHRGSGARSYQRPDDIRPLALFLMAAIALINTPRIALPYGVSKDKLNEARLRKGRPPLMAIKEVRLNIDHSQPVKSPLGDVLGQTPLHHVRAHLRMILGKVAIVSPYWRGNPEVGVQHKRYTVRRAEDAPAKD